jgi:AraC-like DNA-binding protein
MAMSELIAGEPSLAALIARSLNAEIQVARITPIAYPHDTGWRTMPWLVVAQITGCPGVLHIEGASPRMLAPQQAICVRPGVRHRFLLRPGGRGTSRWSHLRFTLLGSIDVLALLPPPPLLAGAAAATVGRLNAGLSRLEGASGLGVLVQRKSLAFSLLAAIADRAAGSSGTLEQLRQIDRLAPALALIDARLGDPALIPADLAAELDLSPSRFHALFKRTCGLPPALYLRRRRMQRAEELLISTELKIHAVAERCGWSDHFHFSRLFKHWHGTGPQAYRLRAAASGW